MNRATLFGKLPAHGDFVRRGGPGAVLTRIDDWLDGELGGAVAAGMPLDEAVAALDGWRFAVTSADAPVIAVAIGEQPEGWPMWSLVCVVLARPTISSSSRPLWTREESVPPAAGITMWSGEFQSSCSTTS